MMKSEEFNEGFRQILMGEDESSRKRRKKEKRDCFWMGMVLWMCLQGLAGDILGIERYIEMTRERWIDIPWPLWLPLIALILWAYHKTKQGNE